MGYRSVNSEQARVKAWTVIRHSGRGQSQARIAYSGTESGARKSYERQSEAIKRGSVLLLDHAGGLQAFKWKGRE